MNSEDEAIIRNKWLVRDSKVSFYEVGELLREIDSLRESIRIYGGHCGGCAGIYGGCTEKACPCGFRQVYIKATKKQNERTEDRIDPNRLKGGVRGSK